MVWSVISVLNRYKLFHVWPRFRSRCRIRSRSELLSWPNPEEPQEWVKRRRFWRKPRQSTSLKSGVEELELLSLVRLLQQEVEEAPSPASGFPPGKNNRCKYTKKLKWERVGRGGGGREERWTRVLLGPWWDSVAEDQVSADQVFWRETIPPCVCKTGSDCG